MPHHSGGGILRHPERSRIAKGHSERRPAKSQPQARSQLSVGRIEPPEPRGWRIERQDDGGLRCVPIGEEHIAVTDLAACGALQRRVVHMMSRIVDIIVDGATMTTIERDGLPCARGFIVRGADPQRVCALMGETW